MPRPRLRADSIAVTLQVYGIDLGNLSTTFLLQIPFYTKIYYEGISLAQLQVLGWKPCGDGGKFLMFWKPPRTSVGSQLFPPCNHDTFLFVLFLVFLS